MRWTQDGQEHESAVMYDAPCTERRVRELEATEGVTDVRSVPAKPGE
ncbi:hypothetical protein [Streptomyces sp. NPDC013187]